MKRYGIVSLRGLLILLAFSLFPQSVSASIAWDQLSPEGATPFVINTDTDATFIASYNYFFVFNAETKEVFCSGTYVNNSGYWNLNKQEVAPGVVVRCGIPDGVYRLVNHDIERTVWESSYFKVVNNVGYPHEIVVVEECCSSVAFIPGIQASRLYSKDDGDEQLWEPFSNREVEELFMNTSGEGVNQSIYTRDLIDKTNTVPVIQIPIYDRFIKEMNMLVFENTITAWKPLPYDWRKSVIEIVSEGVQYRDTISSMVEEIETLATYSKTRKVTIVAHSNGGLVTKALMMRLESEGKANLVDKIVFVAVPQLGTPDAVKVLLHGMNILFGFVLDNFTSRTLAENLPGAYGLLPMGEYFDKVNDPVIVFDPTVAEVNNMVATYSASINDEQTLVQFLKGVDGREKPSALFINMPNIVNQTLLSEAQQLRQSIDEWEPPEHVDITQIIGWGIPTLNGIKYKGTFPCSRVVIVGPCAPYIEPEPVLTIEGDKTVVYESASSSFGKNLYFNVYDFNLTNKDVDHKNIFEAEPVNDVIKNLIQNTEEMAPFISSIKPEVNEQQERLVVSMHSPAVINVYDNQGNHTGPINLSGSDFYGFEEEIPNSFYLELGEVVYIGFDKEEGSRVEIQGTGTGTFTFVVEEYKGDEIESVASFKNIPVTPNLKAIFEVTNQDSILAIDVDGNGSSDFSLSESADQDPVLFLQILKQTIIVLGFPHDLEKLLLQKIDKAISFTLKEKSEKMIEHIKKFSVQIQNKKWEKQKKITQEEKVILLEMINGLVDNIK